MIKNNIDFNNQTILITGGAGFIGSNLAFYFQENYPKSNIVVFDCFRNEDLFFYLNSLNNRVLRLYEIFSLNENINDLELTLETLKPKVFWKDKPKLTEQLKKWNAIRLQKVLKKVSKLELDFKTNNNRNDIVFKRLLVNLCQEASNF